MRRAGGFALPELVTTIVVAAMLMMIFTAAFSNVREKAYLTIDLANIRQILAGSAMYAYENNDNLAHPTWGTDLTGPDGWAYLTSNRVRKVPGALQSTPGSCAGRDVNTPQFTNQVAYFRVGQVTQYLPGVEAAWCPKDVATRRSGRLRSLWQERPMKVTSYCWNGTIGGYVGRHSDPALTGAEKTYKISQFLPTDWQMWEQNESESFYFNDAGNNPEVHGEGVSFRHSNMVTWWARSPNEREIPGVGVVGSFDGAGQIVKLRHAYDLASRKIPAPNALLNGPGYRAESGSQNF
jgi:Tfp pilus assembly protein FimT